MLSRPCSPQYSTCEENVEERYLRHLAVSHQSYYAALFGDEEALGIVAGMGDGSGEGQAGGDLLQLQTDGGAIADGCWFRLGRDQAGAA